MAVAYLTVPQFKLLSVIPPEYIDLIEADQPGWTDARILKVGAWIDARLAKRYATPFAQQPNAPDIVQGWVAALVTFAAYLKRGVDPTDAQVQEIERERDAALAEIKEAADSPNGLFELPLRADTNAGGISKGAPLFYAEASAYHWRTLEREAALLEDQDDGR